MMEINRDLYLKRFFRRGQVPDYACPRCGSHLQSSEPDEVDRADTVQRRGHPGFSAEDDWSAFSLKLQCTRPSCGEPVFMVGEGSVEFDHIATPDGWDGEYVTYFEPKFFFPHLRFFRPPTKTPYSIVARVEASFNLFFIGSGSALNEVRNAIEAIMDDLGIDGTELNDKGDLVRLDIDKRVGLLGGEHRKYKRHLLAIKGLGNWGSHGVETSREDVLDAYKMLSFALQGIYDPQDVEANALADRVKNDARGRVRPPTSA